LGGEKVKDGGRDFNRLLGISSAGEDEEGRRGTRN